MQSLRIPRLLFSAFPPAALCVALLVSHDACAQSSKRIGFGALKRTFDVTATVTAMPGNGGDDGIWGVAYVDGLVYASGSPPLFADDLEFGPRIYVIDPVSTTALGVFAIPEFQFAYGMATDLDGNLLIGGGDGAVLYDRAGNRLSEISSDIGKVPLPTDGDGLPIISGPSLGFSPALGRYAGIAFNPSGDGGNGSIYVGDTRAQESIFEVRVTNGSTINEFPNRGWTCAGLTFDPVTGNLWCNSGSPAAIMELDTDDFLEPTGQWMKPIPLQPGHIIARAGGLEIVPGGMPGYFWGSAYDLVSLSQSGTDYVGFHRLHQIPGVPGYAETYLAGSTGADPIARTPVFYEYGDTLNWGLVHNGRSNYGGPAIHIINMRADAAMTAFTDLGLAGIAGNLPELLALSVISVPATTNALYQFDALVGDPDAPPPQPTGITSVKLPLRFPVFPGDLIRLQSVYFDPNVSNPFPFAASNEFWFVGRD